MFTPFHREGYHGTNLDQARWIAENGFEQRSIRVCFAPMEDLKLAQSYGQFRAEVNGESAFGIIHAEFPGIPEEYGANGEAQIEIPPEFVLGIRVIDLLEFQINSDGLFVPLK